MGIINRAFLSVKPFSITLNIAAGQSSRSLDAINKINYKRKMIAQFFIIYHVREMSELSESFFSLSLLILSFPHPFGHDVIDNQDERESFI